MDSKKSHYFVANYDLEDGYRVCRICNNKFKPNVNNQIYCSKDCYHKAVKITQKRWYAQNRERLIEKQIEYERNKRPPPKYKFRKRSKTLLKSLEYKKCIVIKQELIKKELLSCQLLTYSAKRENRKQKLFSKDRHGFNQEKVDFIKKELSFFGLPTGSTYPVDFPPNPEIDVQEPKNTFDRKYFL